MQFLAVGDVVWGAPQHGALLYVFEITAPQKRGSLASEMGLTEASAWYSKSFQNYLRKIA